MNYESRMPMSERLEQIRISYHRRKATKLAMDDTAIEAAETDSIGVEEEIDEVL